MVTETVRGGRCRRAFAPLVEAGFFEVVYGGVDVGAFLTHHDTIESIHLTGSAATFDAVVWGKQPKVSPSPGLRPVLQIVSSSLTLGESDSLPGLQ